MADPKDNKKTTEPEATTRPARVAAATATAGSVPPDVNKEGELAEHADREVSDHLPAVPRGLTNDERERLDKLAGMKANPVMPPPGVRTEDEEREFRDLTKKANDAERRAALERASPAEGPPPEARLAELKKRGSHLGEGEAIEMARLEEMVEDEKRIAALQKMDKRVEEEEDELRMRQDRSRAARAAAGYRPL